MYSFVLQSAIFLSLGVMLYLFARAIPRVGERVVPSSSSQYLDKLVKRIPLEKIDNFLSGVTEKVLRKSKIVVLKIDNVVSKNLKKFKSTGNGKENKPDIFDLKKSEDASASSEDKPI